MRVLLDRARPLVGETGVVSGMRAISLWQPWATAVALGHKTVETRHWSTSYRGELAIHAAKRWTPEERAFAATERALGRLPERLPLGAVVAVATLADVKPTEELASHVSALNRLYGNFDCGRYGWIFENIRPIKYPVAVGGRQSFFSLPADVEAAVREQL